MPKIRRKTVTEVTEKGHRGPRRFSCLPGLQVKQVNYVPLAVQNANDLQCVLIWLEIVDSDVRKAGDRPGAESAETRIIE